MLKIRPLACGAIGWQLERPFEACLCRRFWGPAFLPFPFLPSYHTCAPCHDVLPQHRPLTQGVQVDSQNLNYGAWKQWKWSQATQNKIDRRSSFTETAVQAGIGIQEGWKAGHVASLLEGESQALIDLLWMVTHWQLFIRHGPGPKTIFLPVPKHCDSEVCSQVAILAKVA